MTEHQVVLHVGMPKTGSTSLQNFLIENRDMLDKKDIYITRAGIDSSGACWPLIYELNKELTNGFVLTDENSHNSKVFNDVKREIENLKSSRKVIFSCEDLYYYSDDYIIEFLTRIFGYLPKVEIYFVMRDLIDYVDSALNQVVKDYPGRWVDLSRSSKSLVNEKLDIFLHLERFRNFPNAVRVDFFTYEELIRLDGGLIGNFMSFLDIEYTGSKAGEYRANPRFKSLEAVLLKNMINMLPLSLNEIRTFKQFLIEWEENNNNLSTARIIDSIGIDHEFEQFAKSVYNNLYEAGYLSSDSYSLYTKNLSVHLKSSEGSSDFLPLCLSEFLSFLKSNKPDAYDKLVRSLLFGLSSNFYNQVLPNVRDENKVGDQNYRLM